MYRGISVHMSRFSSVSLDACLHDGLQVRAIITRKQAGCRDLSMAMGCTSMSLTPHEQTTHQKVVQPVMQQMRHPPTSCLSFALPAAGLQSLHCFLVEIVNAYYPI